MKEYKYTINGKKIEVTIGDIADNVANVTVNGVDYKVEMEPEVIEEKPKVVVKPASKPAPVSTRSKVNHNAIKSPLPGTIIEVKVSVGDDVKEGDSLVILEAMKMNNNITAEKDGKVTAINVEAGHSVMEGDEMIVVE